MAYEIRLFDFQGGDHELPELCPGDDSAKISLAEYSCVFDMLQVTQEPMLLSFGDLISAKVRARNAYGWSEYSDRNTVGQTTQQKPSTPSEAPILVS